jgi:rare lipoprotein A (peptidoglycan hydrolase)
MQPFQNLESCEPIRLSLRNLHGLAARIAFLVAAFFTLTAPPVNAMAPTRHHPGETESGLASWYGLEQGHHTASGERFNPQALTAAHRHLPFGTIVRVTNQLNGRSVELRINDRGPWRHGRIIDVTSAAADILEMKRRGTVPVTVEIIKLGLGRPHAHD